MQYDTLTALNNDRANKRPVALVTTLHGGAQALVYEDGDGPPAELGDDIIAAARQALKDDKSAVFGDGETAVFIQVHNPPLRMIIVGAVHITQGLAEMARMTGYAVTVVDPRRAFAAPERFPDINVSTDWPDDLMKTDLPDRRTAVVTLTHDPKIDDPALEIAIRTDAFYIGALGSNRTHGKRVARLTERGFAEAEIARINAPVGLNIGAKSPAEIAVSVLAEVIETRRRSGAPPAAKEQ
jgi:xanthine dehydrogenase accessory factor